jgi:hypothetical protein
LHSILSQNESCALEKKSVETSIRTGIGSSSRWYWKDDQWKLGFDTRYLWSILGETRQSMSSCRR